MTRPGPSIVVILSDLHIGTADHAAWQHDEEFEQLLAYLVDRAARLRRRCHLVLLGDVVDFDSPGSWDDGGETAAMNRLDAVLADHPAVPASLQGFLSGDNRITLVAGNHDLEWFHPGVRGRLSERLAAGPAQVEFRPWVFSIPGYLYAEHGSQYHDLNAIVYPLQPTLERGGQVEVTYGSIIGQHRRSSGRLPGRLAAEMLRRWRRRPRTDYATLIAAEARRLSLPPAALLEIDRVAARSAARMVGRLAGAALAKVRGRYDPASYQLAALSVIDRILAVHGANVPNYVLGHTHIAERRRFTDGAQPAYYLNPGSWGATRDRGSRRGLPFVELDVQADPRRALASLRAWQPGTGSAVTVSGPDVESTAGGGRTHRGGPVSGMLP